MMTKTSEQVRLLGEQFVDFSDVSDEVLPYLIRFLVSSSKTFGDPRVLEYTTVNSKIARVLHDNPASDAMLRIVYPDANGHPLTEGLDRFLSRSLSGQALRDRLSVCSSWIADNFVREGAKVIDLGGGSGSYAFGAFQTKKPPVDFKWRVLDNDPGALAVCDERTTAESLESVVETQEGGFLSSKSICGQYDYGVLIGVLCGMDHDTAVNCLRRVQLHLRPGGEIYAATLLQRAFDEDPRTFRILCNVGGWQLRPKTLEQVSDIFAEAGWEIISIGSERVNQPGQYALVHARAIS